MFCCEAIKYSDCYEPLRSYGEPRINLKKYTYMYTIPEIQKIIIHCNSVNELAQTRRIIRYLSSFINWSWEEAVKIEAAFKVRLKKLT